MPQFYELLGELRTRPPLNYVAYDYFKAILGARDRAAEKKLDSALGAMGEHVEVVKKPTTERKRLMVKRIKTGEVLWRNDG